MSRATGYVFEAVAERRVVRDWPGGILIADREIRLCIARLVDLAEATCAGRREDVVGGRVGSRWRDSFLQRRRPLRHGGEGHNIRDWFPTRRDAYKKALAVARLLDAK